MSFLDRLRRSIPGRYRVGFEPRSLRPGDALRVDVTPAPDHGWDAVLTCRSRADGSSLREVVSAAPAGAVSVTILLPADVPATEPSGADARDWQVAVRARGGRRLAAPQPVWIAAP